MNQCHFNVNAKFIDIRMEKQSSPLVILHDIFSTNLFDTVVTLIRKLKKVLGCLVSVMFSVLSPVYGKQITETSSANSHIFQTN